MGRAGVIVREAGNLENGYEREGQQGAARREIQDDRIL
jgi:hypothetical protein